MKKITRLFFIVCTMITAACIPKDNKVEPTAVQIKNFTFFLNDNPAKDTADIKALNVWLRANPDKKIIYFVDNFDGRDNSDCYLLYYISGNSQKQTFARVSCSALLKSGEKNQDVNFIQVWRNLHPDFNLISFSALFADSCGSQGFTVLYEK